MISTFFYEARNGKSFIAPQKLVINKAMDREIELLKKKIEERDSLIASQQREIARLCIKKTEANPTSTFFKNFFY